MEKKEFGFEALNNENNNRLFVNGFPVKIHSTGLIRSEEIHPVQFENYFYSILLKSRSEYYNPVNFRHNLDPSFWQDVLDSFYKF